MTKLSSTKLSPCVCGGKPYGPVDIGVSNRLFIRCEPCGYMVGGYSKVSARNLWNAAMRNLSIDNLDRAWAEINAFRMVHSDDWERQENYNDAIGDAIEITEKLGGMDPAKRNKE